MRSALKLRVHVGMLAVHPICACRTERLARFSSIFDSRMSCPWPCKNARARSLRDVVRGHRSDRGVVLRPRRWAFGGVGESRARAASRFARDLRAVSGTALAMWSGHRPSSRAWWLVAVGSALAYAPFIRRIWAVRATLPQWAFSDAIEMYGHFPLALLYRVSNLARASLEIDVVLLAMGAAWWRSGAAPIRAMGRSTLLVGVPATLATGVLFVLASLSFVAWDPQRQPGCCVRVGRGWLSGRRRSRARRSHDPRARKS